MQAAEDAEIRRQLEEGPTLFGSGWRCVDSLEEVDGEFESDEEEVRGHFSAATVLTHDLRNTSSWTLERLWTLAHFRLRPPTSLL